MSKVWLVISTILESAIVMCASELATVSSLDGFYKFALVAVGVAVFIQVSICMRIKHFDLDDVTWLD